MLRLWRLLRCLAELVSAPSPAPPWALCPGAGGGLCSRYSLFTLHPHLGFHTWGKSRAEEKTEPSLLTPFLHRSCLAAMAVRCPRVPAECQARGALHGVSWPRRTAARDIRLSPSQTFTEKFSDSSKVTQLGSDRAQAHVQSRGRHSATLPCSACSC